MGGGEGFSGWEDGSVVFWNDFHLSAGDGAEFELKVFFVEKLSFWAIRLL